MKPDDPNRTPDKRRAEPAINIEPVSFRSDYRGQPPPRRRWVVWLLGLGLLLVCTATAWFVFTAKRVVVQIEPEPERMWISGGLVAPKLGASFVLRPGVYTVRAVKPCYQPLEKSLQVTHAAKQTVRFAMQRLPGLLTLRAHRVEQPSVAVDGAKISVDGEEVGVTPLSNVAVPSGQRRIDVDAEHYTALHTSIDIEGCGVSQSLDVALTPNWADITISSVPVGAQVLVDEKLVGTTPLSFKLGAGTHDLTLRASGYKTWQQPLTAQANQPQTLAPIRLLPADGTLALRTVPSGASVIVGKAYVGETPLRIPLRPETPHVLQISKSGYANVTRKVTVASAKVKKLSVSLVARKGIMQFVITPADAELLIDGKTWESDRQRVELIAIAHQVEIRKKGYQPFRTTITPRPGFPQEIRVALRKTGMPKKAQPALLTAANGYQLQLVRPGAFTMGSSRREQGRRSNETLRRVTLKRPFYIGVREVTNKEFREFRPTHDSGAVGRQSLNRANQPVVQVTWEDAALFCNWLSAKEALPLVYVTQGDQIVAPEPLQTGYRLCTEAEWEYSARFASTKNARKYPWGKGFPPPSKVGNFADTSASDLLPEHLTTYNDGYPVTAPPKRFRPNAIGLYDIGGNVAEWGHDYYSIYPYAANKVFLDPVGPKHGKHRVVRGSSWKHASISALRLAYRDYSKSKRPDLGFRMCRYRKTIPEQQ